MKRLVVKERFMRREEGHGSTRVIIAVLLVLGAAGALVDTGVFFREAAMDVRVSVDEQLVRDLEALKGQRIWFGHHSVGRDILEGVEELSLEAGVDVKIDDGPIGDNGMPLEKIRDFQARALAREADIVVMKLCFADFRPDTNVDAIALSYQEAVARIRAEKPGLRVLHVTPPLFARQMDPQSRLKRFIGRLVWEDDANLRRLELAERLHAMFPGDVVLDLGEVESTRPDATREIHLVRGRRVPMLWPGYTHDGGHLNDLGRRVAAKAFLHALAGAARRTP